MTPNAAGRPKSTGVHIQVQQLSSLSSPPVPPAHHHDLRHQKQSQAGRRGKGTWVGGEEEEEDALRLAFLPRSGCRGQETCLITGQTIMSSAIQTRPITVIIQWAEADARMKTQKEQRGLRRGKRAGALKCSALKRDLISSDKFAGRAGRMSALCTALTFRASSNMGSPITPLIALPPPPPGRTAWDQAARHSPGHTSNRNTFISLWCSGSVVI